MNIRRAKIIDIPRLIPLVRAFHEETLEIFGMGYDTPSVERTLREFILNHIGIVVEVKGEIVGVIGGAIVPSFTDHKQTIFAESMWYILPAHRGGVIGVKLLKLVERYCLDRGIEKIVMIGMCDDRADKLKDFYKRMGYEALEIHYIKDLSNDNEN